MFVVVSVFCVDLSLCFNFEGEVVLFFNVKRRVFVWDLWKKWMNSFSFLWILDCWIMGFFVNSSVDWRMVFFFLIKFFVVGWNLIFEVLFVRIVLMFFCVEWNWCSLDKKFFVMFFVLWWKVFLLRGKDWLEMECCNSFLFGWMNWI